MNRNDLSAKNGIDRRAAKAFAKTGRPITVGAGDAQHVAFLQDRSSAFRETLCAALRRPEADVRSGPELRKLKEEKSQIRQAGSSSYPTARTRRTSTVRGPCTPLTLVISMSTVPDGPENRVIGLVLTAISSRMPSGTVSRTWSCRTTQR